MKKIIFTLFVLIFFSANNYAEENLENKILKFETKKKKKTRLAKRS